MEEGEFCVEEELKTPERSNGTASIVFPSLGVKKLGIKYKDLAKMSLDCREGNKKGRENIS